MLTTELSLFLRQSKLEPKELHLSKRTQESCYYSYLSVVGESGEDVTKLIFCELPKEKKEGGAGESSDPNKLNK